MQSIKEVLMERDGMTADEADTEIESAREDLHNRLADDEMPFNICGELFGLEPDYLFELML